MALKTEKGRLCKGDPDEMKTYQSQFTSGKQIGQLKDWWLMLTKFKQTEPAHRVFKVIMHMAGRKNKHDKIRSK